MWINNTGKIYRIVPQVKQKTETANYITKMPQEILRSPPLISFLGHLLLSGAKGSTLLYMDLK